MIIFYALNFALKTEIRWHLKLFYVTCKLTDLKRNKKVFMLNKHMKMTLTRTDAFTLF